MASSAFERFRFSFFEDTDSARQGLDTAALAELEGEERARAGEMLLHHLPDTRAVIGLGVLRSRRAEPPLVQLFDAERQAQRNAKLNAKLGVERDWWSYKLVELAKALWQIRSDQRWPEAEIDVLASADDPGERQSAAEALYVFRDPAAVRALVTALDDPKALVRHHAACALLAIHDLPCPDDDVQHMVYRVMANEPGRREGGKRDILAAIAGRPIDRAR
jgi:HEAT repeat protein